MGIQALSNQSLPTQEKKLRDYSLQHGLTVLRVSADKGESARTDDRPQFRQMLTYCQQHRREISHVIVSDLSRLARNVLDQGQTIFMLGELGVQLVSVDEPHDNSAAGRLLKNTLGSLNQFFSDSLSEKTKDRMAAGTKQGRWLFVAPLGYRNDTGTKTAVVEPEAATFVRKAFDMVASGQYPSTDDILRLLKSLGFMTRKGRAVTKQTFARMLRNPFYSGWVVSGDMRIRGNHEPLIAQELFDTVQTRLAGSTNSKTAHKKLNDDFPLKGFVKVCWVWKEPDGGMEQRKGRAEVSVLLVLEYSMSQQDGHRTREDRIYVLFPAVRP